MTEAFRILTDRNFGFRVVALMVLGFLALIAAGGTAAWIQWRNQQLTEEVDRTRQIESDLALFAAVSERIETSRRGYLLEPDPVFRDLYLASLAQSPNLLDRIALETRDNALQQDRIRALRAILARQRPLQERSFSLIADGQRDAAITAFESGESAGLLRTLRSTVEAMIAEEQGLLALRSDEQRGSVRTFYAVLALAAALLLFVAIASILVILRYTRDLAASRNALGSLNANLELAVQDRTEDLQRANDEIQRFAYIVSHDLRSPLVNVMGFTAELDTARQQLDDFVDAVAVDHPDLVGEDVRLAAKEDLPEAIGFIRTSTQKMDRLINSILKLSREGRRTIAPEPIDLTEMLQGIADTLQHRLDEAGAEIVIRQPLPALVSDRLAIEQIFSNLVENAVKYLKPGRPGRIEVSGRREGRRVHFEIADNGRGIDPRDLQRVFDLFRRSGAQDQPGEGIGLAHVRALAYRLGGLIDCESELDRGATFRLSLPWEYKLEQKATS